MLTARYENCIILSSIIILYYSMLLSYTIRIVEKLCKHVIV